MNRRHFLALASGLLVPEPTRVYSFLWGGGGPIVCEWGALRVYWHGVRIYPVPARFIDTTSHLSLDPFG